MSTHQQAELDKFAAMAADWWNPNGPMRPLHDINPLRTHYIDQQAQGLKGKRVLDIGCGAGLLAEALAARGAHVTGIDLAGQTLEAARQHARQSGLDIDYRQISSSDMAAETGGGFDIVVAYEMLEHVDEPAYIVSDSAKLVAPGGDVFFSTINRNPLAGALAIGGAEYILELMPRGTHAYHKLIRPAELATYCRQAQPALTLRDISGMQYNPWTRSATLGHPPRINYFVHAVRSGA